jgi:hypothetical protein
MKLLPWSKGSALQPLQTAQPAEQKVSGLKCRVLINVYQGPAKYSWSWKLVAPHIITKQQQLNLDSLVGRYCEAKYGAEPESSSGVVRSQIDRVSFVILQ